MPLVAAVPVPPGSIWVAGTPDARLAWNELYFKGVFHRRAVPPWEGVQQ